MPTTIKPEPQNAASDLDIRKRLQEMKVEAEEARAQMVVRGEILPAEEFAGSLGVSLEELSRAVAEHRLFALDVADKTYYPGFYLDPTLDRRRLECVSQVLGDLGGWSCWQFFTRPKGSLSERTPLEVLRGADGLDAVLATALAFAER